MIGSRAVMVFGMTAGEYELVAFVFALVLGAGLLPRLAERLAEWRAARRERE